ncbi:unnamed protein product [Polarella glacialis]|uniref:Uncharacterized protein n=1 Tax=Polarella glacialis TaxID=89957 RepID=A0A813J8J1_POLGL|nr:unnamed protein product [Polarella glacialis]
MSRAEASVEAVLKSRGFEEALGLRRPPPEDTGRRPERGRRSEERGSISGDIENGQAQLEHRFSRQAISEAFLCVAVEVHPVNNQHPEALLALRWTVESMQCLLGDASSV